MTKKELAALLNGRSLGDEMSEQDEVDAKENDLIVIYGYSDDLAEIRGAIYEEVSCYDGGVIPFLSGDLLEKKCDNDDCPHEEDMLEKAKIVKAHWCSGKIPWTYETEIPHETFDIMEDGIVFCRGIVFDRRDIEE